MKTLKQLKGSRKAVFTFGRMNPPTRGHEKLIEKLLKVAKQEGAEPHIFLSHSQDPKKNPLTQKQKIKFLKFSIPEAEDAFVEDPKVRNIFDAIKYLEDHGFTDIILVVGEDRIKEFKDKIPQYIGHPDKSKSLNIDSFKAVSAGNRDPDADDVTGASSSKLRDFAAAGDFKSFYKLCPSKLAEKFARDMFDSVRKGLQIAEEVIRLKNSLDIPRHKMPQIRTEDIKEFIKDLEKNGIPISTKQLSIKDLKPTQHEINSDKIKKKGKDILSGEREIKPFIVSLDNYILDGHHQLFSLLHIAYKKKVTSYVIGLKMEELLKVADKFPKVYYKEIDE